MTQNTHRLLVDFVTHSEGTNSWQLVLVEQGPWADMRAGLARLQDRLYDALDVLIDGTFAEMYPQSAGRPGGIRVDCYGVPKVRVRAFFDRFVQGVAAGTEYGLAIEQSPFVSDVQFHMNFDLVGSVGAPPAYLNGHQTAQDRDR